MNRRVSVRRGHALWQVVNTWRWRGRRVVFTSESPGVAGHNECFFWLQRHTPFSFAEAMANQGYALQEVSRGV